LKAGAGVSVITRIEVLVWRGHTADSIRESTSLLGLCVEYPLSEPVISECIRMRQTFGIKLPDPMISNIITLAEQTPDLAMLWLYGSHASGTQREDSDYDLAVALQTLIRDNTLATRLRPELLAMDLL
jgi:hypothetical protein